MNPYKTECSNVINECIGLFHTHTVNEGKVVDVRMIRLENTKALLENLCIFHAFLLFYLFILLVFTR